MKLTLFALALLLSTYASAQIPGKKSTEPYQSPSGTIYGIGDTIYFVTGSRPDGSYTYVFNQSVMMGPEKTHISSSWSGLHTQIQYFKRQENRMMGNKTYAAFKTGPVSWAVDIEQALKAGEIRIGQLSKTPLFK